MHLAHLLARQARSAPERIGIMHGTEPWAGYGEWARRSAALAAAMSAAGLQPSDRIVLFMRNHPRYLELLWAAWWGGFVVVPVNAKLHPREVEWIVENAQARWAFVTSDVAPHHLAGIERQIDIEGPEFEQLMCSASHVLAEPHAGTGPEDLAWLFYTSGTTGRPKGVMLSHRNLMTMGTGYFVDVDHVAQDDAIVYAAPMSHGAGIYSIPHLMAGARHVVPQSGGMDAPELFALGRAIGPLSTFAAPTIVNRLVEQAQREGLDKNACARSFKTIVYGGAPMYAADIRRALEVMGDRFVQIYGQGESPMVGTSLRREELSDAAHPNWERRIASVGRSQTPVQVRVRGNDGQTLEPGAIGEVQLKGDSVMMGYWNNPQATADAIQDGWLSTGDMGHLDPQGWLTLVDRSKDLIISGGSNIYPREIEEVILALPGVQEVAVVGAPDSKWGEVVIAFVVLEAGTTLVPADVDRACLEAIARFKRPKQYVQVPGLPKNNYGKVLKTELRKWLAQVPLPSGAGAPHAAWATLHAR